MVSRARNVGLGRQAGGTVVAVAAMALALSGCLDRKLKPLNPCLVSGVVAEIAVTNIDKVDLLFMVDNSGSMREEQEALRQEFPDLIRVLTTGDRDGDMVNDFPPAKDLHLGVVSSDMGLVSIEGIPGCEGQGDDGVMRNVPDPNLSGCQANYPRFLEYEAGINDPGQTARDFGCIASLGTEGCGFEQQLESALKALWPEIDIDPETDLPRAENRIRFLPDRNGFGQVGHGGPGGANDGFLRNDPSEGISLIAIIMVTDEEDCSSEDTRHFTPDIYLEPSDPLYNQDLNLRCFYNPENLYSLDRYVHGYRALRPGNENLVIFGAIVGVPPDLIDNEVDLSDEVARNAYYDRILNDDRMIEMEDPNRTPEQGGNLLPSCRTDTGRAYPPRRFVEVARRFGENGVVQSICNNDFGPALDAIIEVIAKQLGAVCLPRQLVRDSDGVVDCNVVWELPPPNIAQSGTFTECSQADFLNVPDEGRATVSDRGGQVCEVRQLPVIDGAYAQGMGQGWYYDDFSEEVAAECTGDSKQRVAFTPDAKPPTGVTVKLECLNETQSLANDRTDLLNSEQPSIGDACDVDGTAADRDAVCVVHLRGNETDNTMICHPELNVCVRTCSSDNDCPAAWVCDDRPATLQDTVTEERPNGTPICVNPTCGDL